MTKLKSMLLGVAMALPFAAVGAVETGIQGVDAAPLEAQSGPTQQTFECCWVYFNGMWWCISYCA
ncbi:MAG: hypothetical protein JXB36_17550 [Gammaproteobacteria bacterium]|nr:hypothetical protein [Gammaproteobacteria bacterium]